MYRPLVKTAEDIAKRQKEYDTSEKERLANKKANREPMGTLDRDINDAEKLVAENKPDGQKILDAAVANKKAYYAGNPYNPKRK